MKKKKIKQLKKEVKELRLHIEVLVARVNHLDFPEIYPPIIRIIDVDEELDLNSVSEDYRKVLLSDEDNS